MNPMKSINNIAMLGLLLGAGCGEHKEMSTPPIPTPSPTSTLTQAPTSAEPPAVNVITTNHEALAALGKVVQIRGTVQREKIADTVNVGDLSVRCINFRFPDASVGNTVTAEGKLAITTIEPVTRSPNGEVSQGGGEGDWFVIYNCVMRTPSAPETPTMINTKQEALAAMGKVVQIRGTVQREKLGDTVNVGALSVRCPDFRFPDASTGNTVTVEGKLDIFVEEDETLSPNGDHNQGYKGGASTFVIYHCVVR